jgi:hypothetical protein
MRVVMQASYVALTASVYIQGSFLRKPAVLIAIGQCKAMYHICILGRHLAN